MKYLMCYDVHNSRGDAGVYADINRAMEEKFEVLVKCTESVYLFEAGAMDLDRLKESIRVKLHFVPDLDFHVVPFRG